MRLSTSVKFFLLFISTPLLFYMFYLHQSNLDSEKSIRRSLISSEGKSNNKTRYYFSPETNIKQIFYNRVGKAGSRSLNDVFKELSERNNFSLHLSEDFEHLRLKPAQEEEFVEQFESYEEPYLYNRHLYFVDFTKYGYKQPVYINLIRDPLTIRVSHFYYKQENKYYDDYNLTNISLEDCILMQHPFCSFKETVHSLILYFCGHDYQICDPHHIGKALQFAMRNVERSYWVVGLLEHFQETLEALELALPEYFTGAREAHAQVKKDQQQYASHTKRMLSEKATQYFKDGLAPDYKFYEFIKQRFFQDLENLRKQNNMN